MWHFRKKLSSKSIKNNRSVFKIFFAIRDRGRANQPTANMSKGKIASFSRPEPPAVKQIVEDIQNITQDDIVLNLIKDPVEGTNNI